MSIDEQFVDFVIKSLVTKPDEVKIKRTIDEKGVLLELTVDPEDLGRVIGKRGATAQSVRTLLRALGTKNDARYNLKIVDNGVAPSERRHEEKSEDSWSSNNDAQKSPDNQQDEEVVEEIIEEKESDVVAKTRKELEDLDDLDV